MTDLNGFKTDLDQYIVGQLADGSIKEAVSRFAEQDIEYGRGLVVGSDAGNNVKNVTNSKAVLDFDADFVTGNTIDLKVNGVAIAQVPFDTDQATTKANLITAIDNLDNILAEDGGARAIDITIVDGLSNAEITDVVVAGGASQAGFTITVSSLDTIVEGIALLRHGEPLIVGGDDAYRTDDQVTALRKGTVICEAIATVNYGDDVYINIADTTNNSQGRLTNVSTGNLKIEAAKFEQTVVGTPAAPALVKVRLNMPV